MRSSERYSRKYPFLFNPVLQYSLRLTREGKRFIIALSVIAFAALNTGNNLMYLVFSFMLATALVGLFSPLVTLRKTDLFADPADEIHAGEPVLLGLIIHNSGRLFHARSLRISSDLLHREVTAEKVAPGEEIFIREEAVFPRRGRYSIGEIRIETGYPFIFFRFQKRFTTGREVIVYPALFEMDPPGPPRATDATHTGLREMYEDEEFSHIRDFRAGDPLRKIHWKATAKHGSLKARTFQPGISKDVTIILDNARTDSPLFERAVSHAATLAALYIDAGYPVRLITCRKTLPFGTGREHLYKIFDILALIEMEDSLECPERESISGYSILILISEDSPMGEYRPVVTETVHASHI